ncbi:hypothetical protein [Abyssogena phaseoliformis symbiont]|uniref:hypothetical protein n=1 Tax=Abyssogena phaseoliformis symbiont TaxID=596095 RepID=UPI001CECF8B2|nr:hypothetical protein [Abyssogena phaseoliformis symbiont]
MNKQKNIFFGDSLSGLNAAKQYGIGTIIAINKPSSKMEKSSLSMGTNMALISLLMTH